MACSVFGGDNESVGAAAADGRYVMFEVKRPREGTRESSQPLTSAFRLSVRFIQDADKCVVVFEM